MSGTAPVWDHWIAGAAALPAGGERIDSRDPATGAVVARVGRGDAADVAAAVAAAAGAQPAWAALAPAERGRVLWRLGESIRQRADELERLECAETGKLDAAVEIEAAAGYFEMYAQMVRSLRGETIDLGSATRAFTSREPWGVVGIVTPWNAPLNQAAREVAPAIAAGNAVVVKPSELTSTTTLLLGELARDAGIPDGVVNVVTGYGAEAGAALVDHPDVRKVAFTGSVATGRVVARAAAAKLMPLTLELGGKSPNVIFADADLASAAPVAARAFTANAGQVCSAGTRLLVQREIHDEFVAAVAEVAAKLTPGVGLGPLTTPDQHRKVVGYLELAEREGARPVVGGTAALAEMPAGGLHVPPTVYVDVRNSMRIAQEEIFGPVLVAIAFEDEDEAVALANDSDFGLVAGVWTRDVARALRVAGRLAAGNVYVNGWGAPNDVPFGGWRDSGYGREKGFAALEDFTQTKSVVVHGVDSGG